MSGVSVEGLSRHFGGEGRPAVHGVSFTASEGAITALLGPSGSGKTTLLRLIAGLEEPDAGVVRLGGQDCTRMPAQKRGAGVVFQGYALFPNLSVRQNIAFGLEVQGVPRAQLRARVDELLALVQLEELGDRHPGQLSGGQRQRVAFARALAPRPRVLLLDEPFGALDTRVRLELREWLLALHEKTRVTTLLVTHDQEEALEFSEQVVVLNHGRVEQAGTPQDIYDRPSTAFVASFVGGATVLRGRVKSGLALVADQPLPAPQGAPDGAQVRAFVRPHEVGIARANGEPGHANLARVETLARVAGLVKLRLRLHTGESLGLELSHAASAALGLARGELVTLDLSRARLFVVDGSAE